MAHRDILTTELQCRCTEPTGQHTWAHHPFPVLPLKHEQKSKFLIQRVLPKAVCLQ